MKLTVHIYNHSSEKENPIAKHVGGKDRMIPRKLCHKLHREFSREAALADSRCIIAAASSELAKSDATATQPATDSPAERSWSETSAGR